MNLQEHIEARHRRSGREGPRFIVGHRAERGTIIPPLCAVEIPPWLVVGAVIAVHVDKHYPYTVLDVSPLMCMLSGDPPWATETELLVKYWGPVAAP